MREPTAKLCLRPTTAADLPFVLAAEQHPANAPFVAGWPEAQHAAALRDPDLRHLLVERADDGAPVGYAILAGLASPHRSVELRRLVITEKGRGHGRQALALIQALAFDQLGAHRLWLDVKATNQRAQALYRACGFVVEGTLRDAFRGDDSFESLVLMALLEPERRRLGQAPAPAEPFWSPLVPELTVAHLDGSLRFYTLVGFGVRFQRDDPPFAYLELGQAQLMLEAEHAGGWITAALERPLGRGVNLQVEVADVRAIADALAGASIPLFRAPQASWYAVGDGVEEGQLELLVQDPDGYLLRFVEPLGTRRADTA